MGILTIIIILALIATVFVFTQGIITMVRGGTRDEENCGQLMSLRVTVQGIAVALILIALFMSY